MSASGLLSSSTEYDTVGTPRCRGLRGSEFREVHEVVYDGKKAKPSRFAFGHDCYPGTIVDSGTENAFAVTIDNGFDTDETECSAVVDDLTKGTRRAFKHLNFMGTIPSEDIACCSAETFMVVFDPCTPRDNVHRAYDSHDKIDESVNTPDSVCVVGIEDCAAVPVLMLKTIPLGVGTGPTGVSFVATVEPLKCSKVGSTSVDKSN